MTCIPENDALAAWEIVAERRHGESPGNRPWRNSLHTTRTVG